MSSPLTWLLSSTAKAGGDATFWMPPQASTFAEDVDFAYYFIYWVDLAFFVALMGAMFWFAIRYRQRSPDQKTSDLKGSHTIELIWAVAPSFLLIAMFVLGFKGYMKLTVPPADAMNVRVYAQKWQWTYEYPDLGIKNQSVLVVPQGTPVRLTMSSKDVLHSFYVPDFRIKKDVVPNRYSVVWFQVDEIHEGDTNRGNMPVAVANAKGLSGDGVLGDADGDNYTDGLGPGEHQVFCTEYCGTDHSRMYSRVQVVTPEAFEAWAEEQAKPPDCETAAECGEITYQQVGCAGCHSTDGTRLVGPTFKGVWGSEERLDDGSTVTVDDNYVRESIEIPGAKIVSGYAPQMPSYQGQLSEEEMGNIIEFIKSLR